MCVVFLHLSQKQLANPVEFFYINNFIICCISKISIPTDFIQQLTIIQSLAFFPAIHSSIYLAPHTVFICSYSNCLFTFYKRFVLNDVLIYLANVSFVFQILTKTIFFSMNLFYYSLQPMTKLDVLSFHCLWYRVCSCIEVLLIRYITFYFTVSYTL